MLPSSTQFHPSVGRRTPIRWTVLRARGRLIWCLGLHAIAVLVVLSILTPATTFPSYHLGVTTVEESDLALTRPDVAASVQMVLPAALQAIRSVAPFHVVVFAAVAIWWSNPALSMGLPGWGTVEPFPPVGQRRRALLQVYRN